MNETNTQPAPAPVQRLVGRIYILMDAPDYEPATIIGGYFSEKNAIAEAEKLRAIYEQWEREEMEKDKSGRDAAWATPPPGRKYATVCAVDLMDDPPNAQGQPAATDPAQQAGRGPLGCADLLGADHQPERQP
jgi:hypothetical protein